MTNKRLDKRVSTVEEITNSPVLNSERIEEGTKYTIMSKSRLTQKAINALTENGFEIGERHFATVEIVQGGM